MDAHNVDTVIVKACCSCGTGLLEFDKFCRRCGERQPTDRLTTVVSRETPDSPDNGREVYRPISGPLVKAVVDTVSLQTTSPLYGQVMRRGILVLISIPIWIMILLLSPIDAYVAARGFSRAL
jgi:hypothetical protein